MYTICSLVRVFQTGRKPSLSLTTVSPIKFFWFDFSVGCYRAWYLELILWIVGGDLQEAVVGMELSELAAESFTLTQLHFLWMCLMLVW